MKRAILLAIPLFLTACAHAPTDEPCRSLARFAAQVTKDKADGFPQPYALEYYRAQVAGDAEHSTNVTKIVRGVYLQGDDADAVYRKCKAGAFGPKQ